MKQTVCDCCKSIIPDRYGLITVEHISKLTSSYIQTVELCSYECVINFAHYERAKMTDFAFQQEEKNKETPNE